MRLRLVSALALAVAVAPVTAAGAATISPSTTGDVVGNDGQCSLREAITAARTHAPSGSLPGECPAGTGADVIGLAPGHYLLSIEGAKEDANASGDLDIGSDLTIKGAGSSSTFIETNRPDRVIQVLTGVTAAIEGVTVTGGRSPAGSAGESVTGEPTSRGKEGTAGEPGGGIFNQGTLTLRDSVVSGNSTGDGGKGGNGTGNAGGNGIGGSGGPGGAGGGIASTGALLVSGSVISGNSTGVGGAAGAGSGSPGGIGGGGGWALGGSGGYGGFGGGIASEGPGTLTLTRSAVSGNTTGAGGESGGAFGGHGESGTDPFGGYAIGGIGGGGGGGAGLSVRSVALVMTESTISNNATGGGAKAGIGVGGYGGPGVGAGAGGEGGEGSGGIGGEGGPGGGIDGRFAVSAEITRSAITGNTTGDGGATNLGQGGAGGAGGSSGGAGGNGGRGTGGSGGTGGVGGGITLSLAVLKDTTIADNRSGVGQAGETGVGGSGGLGKGGGLNGTGGKAIGGRGGSGGSAGGIFLGFTAKATLTQATISGNSTGAGSAPGAAIPGSPGGGSEVEPAGTQGAGEALLVQGGVTATLTDTILASSAGPNCVGKATDGGHNISFPDASCPGANVDPQLGPLQDNGGPTPTAALPAASPAVDAVPAVGAGCDPTDQRGVLRPAGGACDIGAFELATPTAITGAASGVGTNGASVVGVAENPDLGAAGAFFQYGTTAAYGLRTASQPVGATTLGFPFGTILGGLAPGTTYHYRAVVTNAAGTSFGADQTLTTARVPPKPANQPPALGALAIRPSSVLPDRGRGASITRKRAAKRGATVSYTDSQPATTSFTVQRQVSGYRVGRLCAAKRPAHRKGRVRRCTRFVAVGSFSHTDRKGPDSFHFTGRVKGRPLAKGRYQLVAVPRAGGLTGAPVRVAFNVV